MRTRFHTPRTVFDTVDRKIHVVARNLHLTRRLIPTVCVSPPRSGHHLLTNYLFKYFGGDPTFPDLSGHETNRRGKQVIVAGPLHYCEYYHHCRRFPCVDPLVNMMKFHDRAGGQRPAAFAHIIVQLRNPLLSTRSFYSFRYKRDPLDSDAFVEMLRAEIAHWTQFVTKWALAPHPSRLVVRYDDLIRNPSATLARAIRFIQPGRPVDEAHLRRCIESQRVIRNDWVGKQPGLWADARVSALEQQVIPLLERVGIGPLFTGVHAT